MNSEMGNLSEDALRDISYLTRSRNRVQILGAVAEEPRTPRTVADLTGASRSTIQRILSELEDHGWIRRTNEGSYVATATGNHVINELVPFVESMETIRELGEAVATLPTDSLPIGIQHFSDATIIRPKPNDPNAPGAFFTGSLRETSELRCLVDIAAPLALEKAMRDGVVNGNLQSEHILTGNLVRYIHQHADRMQHWKDLTKGGADVYCYDDDIPCNIFILDKMVILGKTPPPGEGCVLIESECETVLQWAHETVTAYRTKADRLTGEAFTDDRASSAKQT